MRNLLMFGFVVLLTCGTVAQAEIIYTENFGTGTTNVSPNSVGWGAWYGSSATDDGSDADAPLYICQQCGNSDGRFMAMTGETLGLITTSEPGSVSTDLLESISFLANRNATTSKTRIVVKIGSDWYATDDTFAMSEAGGLNLWEQKAETHTFNWTNAASKWRDLDFTAGSKLELKLTNPTSDLSGSVTEFGVYLERDDSTMRIDDFTIGAIPEPGSAALLGTGLIVLLLGWMSLRRRRRA